MQLSYHKYYLIHLFIFLSLLFAFYNISEMMILFIIVSAVIMFGDIFIPKEHNVYDDRHKKQFNFAIYLSFLFLFIYLFSITYLVKFNIASDNLDWYLIFGNALNLGIYIGVIGTNLGHELIHRRRQSFDYKLGLWGLALSWDTAFAIEHVHGHHKNIGTWGDPATARRGENIFMFIFRSSYGSIVNAWSYEKNNMKKQNYITLSMKNRLVSGFFKSIFISSLIWFIGGINAIIIYFIAVLWAKILLETVNYIEHYGLVRKEGSPVKPFHSWNDNSWMSSFLLFNLNRHSAHHEKGTLPYWRLNTYENYPMLPMGYLSMVYFALLIPPLYHYIMKKKLRKWDDLYLEDTQLIS